MVPPDSFKHLDHLGPSVETAAQLPDILVLKFGADPFLSAALDDPFARLLKERFVVALSLSAIELDQICGV
jgi:hypothetical protein